MLQIFKHFYYNINILPPNNTEIFTHTHSNIMFAYVFFLQITLSDINIFLILFHFFFKKIIMNLF